MQLIPWKEPLEGNWQMYVLEKPDGEKVSKNLAS